MKKKERAITAFNKSRSFSPLKGDGGGVDHDSPIIALSMTAGLQTLSVMGLPDESGVLDDSPTGSPAPGYKDYLYVESTSDYPFIYPADKNARSLARSSTSTLVVFDDGTVKGIGYDPRTYDSCSDIYGDMGIYPCVKWFNLPSGYTNVVQIKPGPMEYFMLRQADGTVLGWGQTRNEEGRGDVPTTLSAAKDLIHTFDYAGAVLEDGSVELWGDYCPSAYQTAVSSIYNASNSVDGNTFSVLHLDNKNIYAFGANSYGQTSVPSGITTVEKLAVGEEHTLALLDDGSVVSWGGNTFGQTNVPSSVLGAVDVAAGSYHSLAALSDGTIIPWGSGAYGSTNIPSYANNAMFVGAAGSHGYSLLADGSAALWGGWSSSVPDDLISVIA